MDNMIRKELNMTKVILVILIFICIIVLIIHAFYKKPTTLSENISNENVNIVQKNNVSEQVYEIGEPDNNVKDPIIIEEPKSQKFIALTFDDGPSKYTKELLNILKEEDAKATFFVLGSRAKRYSGALKRMVLEGHQIGSHAYSHKYLTKLSDSQLKHEINTTNKIIKVAAGINVTAIRPPYGAYNSKVKKAANLPIILWSIDSKDWESRDENKIYKLVIKKARDGDIVILHDIYPTTVSAVKRIIPKLKEEGYTFVTVDELIKMKNGKIEKNKVYRNAR